MCVRIVRVKTPTWYRVSMSLAHKTAVGANWAKICQELVVRMWPLKRSSNIFGAANQKQKERTKPTPTTPRFWFLVGYLFSCANLSLPGFEMFHSTIFKCTIRGWVWARTSNILSNIHWHNYLGINLGAVSKTPVIESVHWSFWTSP